MQLRIWCADWWKQCDDSTTDDAKSCGAAGGRKQHAPHLVTIALAFLKVWKTDQVITCSGRAAIKDAPRLAPQEERKRRSASASLNSQYDSSGHPNVCMFVCMVQAPLRPQPQEPRLANCSRTCSCYPALAWPRPSAPTKRARRTPQAASDRR